MSRIDKWLPFFEESSKKRDVISWWKPIEEKVLNWGMEVSSIVSDRAKALIKLGTSDYLNVISIPDLFHFTQDFGKLAGLQIGKKRAAAKKVLSNIVESGKGKLKEELAQVEGIYQKYRNEMQQINKTIHPFNDKDEWTSQREVEKSLLHCFRSIASLATKLDISIVITQASKILAQILPISQGVEAWVNMAKQELGTWLSVRKINKEEKNWLIKNALPFVYWQIQLNRTPAKLRNKDLRIYYKKRLQEAKQRALDNPITKELETDRQQKLLLMAHKLAITFQRASSQTEGRNGYLAFINHAYKGFPKDRLNVLTVIHNFDIKRKDGTTPANRLFNKDFPDLFDFICANVTGFKEPRKIKSKSLTISLLQH